ncbi:MAG: stage III sporulation protein D [Clostridiales bacterium]|nr:stage III sporulation protein D [Clostridiales bacterium]
MLENTATVRATANHFGLSKSTVHTDLTKRLKRIDENLYRQVKHLLFVNLSERHIRGGIATRKKFKGK